MLGAAVLAATVFSSAHSATVTNASSLTPAQQQQMEKVVHDYLVSHPEVLVEASQVLQKRQQQEMQNQAEAAITSQAYDLFKPNMTMAGNLKGDVTLVEFFDYQCGHCKKMQPVVSALIQKNKNLRVIYKEFPIFGKSSEFASQAVLAAAKQGKYTQLQEALFKFDKPLNEEAVLGAAKAVGLNIDQLKKDMDSSQVKEELAQNRALAEKIHLMGTPAFVVAYTPMGQFDAKVKPAFLPGGASESAMQEMINQIQQKK
jgi:protein-disulfide isomerase